MFQTNSYSLSQIATVGVMPHLISRTENVQRVLALEYLLRQIGHHMRHGQLHIAAVDVMVMQCPLFSDADVIKRTHDGIRQLVLLPRTLDKILCGQLLESVGRTRRGTAVLGSLGSGILRCTFEYHLSLIHISEPTRLGM